MPKVRLEEIAFRDVGSAAGSNGAEFVHTSMHGVGGFAALGNVGFVIGNSGICRPLAVRNDGKSKSPAHCGIHRSVFGRLNGFQRRAGESLIEMEFHLAEAASREQSV